MPHRLFSEVTRTIDWSLWRLGWRTAEGEAADLTRDRLNKPPQTGKVPQTVQTADWTVHSGSFGNPNEEFIKRVDLRDYASHDQYVADGNPCARAIITSETATDSVLAGVHIGNKKGPA